LALAFDNSIPILEFSFKSYVNTLAYPFMLLSMAIVIIAITLFESSFAISFKDFLVTPLLGPFAIPFDKPSTLPMEKQPPFLVMKKVQHILKQGIKINSSWSIGGLFSHKKDEDPINPIIVVLKQ
jgi:hypothetical protein